MNYKVVFMPILLTAAMSSPSPRKHDMSMKTPESQIKGHVRDKDKNPLSKAILKLYDCDANLGNCGKAVRFTRSNSDGSFILKAKGIQPGLYSLEASLSPFYISKAKVPVILPDDNGKSFDFVMKSNTRDAAGNLVGVSAEDAKEIYAAARIEHNTQLEVLSAKIINQRMQGTENKLFDARAIPNSPTHGNQSTIQSAINKDPTLSSGNVTVEVKNGKEVELSGNVPTNGAKDAAERIAKENAGGLKVKNHLKVADAGSVEIIEGCLNGSAGNFALTDISGKTWQLAGDTSKLSDHVGHQVRILGTDNSAASSSSSHGAASATNPSSTAGATGAGSSSAAANSTAPQSTFNVTKVKMISSSCSTSR